jgi:hypothetical protein
MNPKNQTWQPLDPTAESLPQEIESALDAADSLPACVVILVDSEIDRDWGAQASLAVAKKWAASGHRVILADGCLDRPVLHETVGVENGEGVSDMVLYGASAQRIAERVEDRLMLAPAGTPVVEVAEVLKHVRWDMMINGCREAKATLVFHVSTGTPGSEAMAERADGVLVLAPASKDIDAILGSASGPLIAVLGPVNGDSPGVAVAEEDGDVAVAEELGGPIEVEAPAVEAPDVEVPEVEVPEAEVEMPEANEGVVATPSDEAVAGLLEDEVPSGLTIDDLPDMPATTGEDGETSDAFSVNDLGGEQYGEGDSPDAGVEAAELDSGVELDSGADLEVASPEDGDFEAEAVVPSSDTSFSMDGFETGAGIGLDDTPADVEEPPSDEELLAAAPVADAGDGIDLGIVDLETSEPTSISDSLSELVIEEPSEEAEADAKTSEAPPGRRRRYRGLARLERTRKRKVFIRQFLTGLLTVLIVGGGGVAAAYYGLVNIPGITPPERVRSYVPAPAALPGPVPQSAIMSHVLMIDSWRTIETPVTTADALRSRLPNLLFFVTPIEVAGAPQFALYAGPAYSAVEANALKDPIAIVMDRLDPNDWTVLNAPYAFYFGEYDSATNAAGRIQALAGISIPAYSLEVAYADGSTAVRVYGGAFPDEFQAVQMGRLVSDADVGGMVLTSRRGTLPE